MPKLSIITINLNNVEGLRRTVDSVVGQIYRDFEWIVVDGGSVDGSLELIEEYSDRITWWVSEPDSGIYNAMNKGILASHGEYLLFLNSGDYLHDRDVLHKVVPQLQGKDFYTGHEYHEDLDVSSGVFTHSQLFFTMSTASLPHQSTFISRKVFDKYGLYREDLTFASDWYMFYKALIMGDSDIEKLGIFISVIDVHGVSRSEAAHKERENLFSEFSNIDRAVRFYYENYDIVKALRGSKVAYFLFRIYFFLYRNWKRQ